MSADGRPPGWLDSVSREDVVTAVDVRPGDGDKALEEMVAAGAKLATTG